MTGEIVKYRQNVKISRDSWWNFKKIFWWNSFFKKKNEEIVVPDEIILTKFCLVKFRCVAIFQKISLCITKNIQIINFHQYSFEFLSFSRLLTIYPAISPMLMMHSAISPKWTIIREFHWQHFRFLHFTKNVLKILISQFFSQQISPQGLHFTGFPGEILDVWKKMKISQILTHAGALRQGVALDFNFGTLFSPKFFK